jgi:rRNA maturation protein Nop10
MRFAQFYHNSTGYIAGSIPPRFSPDHVRPIPACGSDSVMVFDGRYSLRRCVDLARVECKRRGFTGFTIEVGARFADSRIERALETLRGA